MNKASFVRLLAPCLLGITALGSACVATPDSRENTAEEAQAVVAQPTDPPILVDPIGVDDPDGLKTACVVPPDGTRPDPTLVNTDPAVLARFPLSRVVQQLVDLAGTSGVQTGTLLYQQLWDSFDTTANAAFPGTPHCDDPGAINDFPLDCTPNGRPEVVLKTSATTTFTPVALMNRFDLAPASGEHCGEYRIIYARTSGPFSGRDFIIFEGALPNPDPSCGIESCRPVVDFWESLANFKPNSTGLADALDAFYFTGLSGFEPVVHPGHYGSAGGSGYGATGAGQIRTNLFMNFVNWQLREHHLTQPCGKQKGILIGPTVPCNLVMTPVTDKSNPFKSMFSASSTDPRAAQFQADFPAQVGVLANDNVNLIGLGTADTFNAGQSNSQISSERYQSQLPPTGSPNAFTNAIDAELLAIGRTDLNARDIAARATTQSCAGCHQLSPTNFGGGTLGGGVNPSWPDSRGFVHVDESGFLSPALWCTFLPFRKSVLDAFSTSPHDLCADAAQKASLSDGSTVAGKTPGAN